MSVLICPYSGQVIREPSNDHIFPQFLGGKKTVVCERSVNSAFGNSFEARTARSLQTLHVYISSWGLPLRAVDPIWRNAHVSDGRTYHLRVGPTSAQPELASPIIERDEQGRIIAGEFRSLSEAENFAKSLIAKGKAKELKLELVPPKNIDTTGLNIEIQISPDLQRLALKMVMALAQFGYSYADTCPRPANAWEFLSGKEISIHCSPTNPAYVAYPELDAVRSPLAHLIYIEPQGRTLVGIVQFFGFLQVYCELEMSIQSAAGPAFLGTLDPVTGLENIGPVTAIRIPKPPKYFAHSVVTAWIKYRFAKLGEEARIRGATQVPEVVLDIQIT
jgi:hypothetical protein